MPIEEIPLNVEVPRELLDALRRSKRFGPNIKVVVGAAVLDALRRLHTQRGQYFDLIGNFNDWVDGGCKPIEEWVLAPPQVAGKRVPGQPKAETVKRKRA